jgi:hypothetical protein
MLRNTIHFAILKGSGDRSPEITTRSSLRTVADSVPFCPPFPFTLASFPRLLPFDSFPDCRPRHVRDPGTDVIGVSWDRSASRALLWLPPPQEAHRKQDGRVGDRQGE